MSLFESSVQEQKKVLFTKPGSIKVAETRANADISSKFEHQQVDSVDLRADTKKELILVLGVCLIITAFFAGIFITDRSKDWIEDFSLKIASKMIRNF